VLLFFFFFLFYQKSAATPLPAAELTRLPPDIEPI
jgi:hypothetical protein